MAEIWMDIKGYNGKYQVSDKGRVWSVYSNKVLSPGYDKDGYERYVLMSPHGKKKYERGHRLVALMFCHKPEGYNVVNHKNMIKDDNRAENLEWSTVALNTKHAYHNSQEIRDNTTRASQLGAEKTRMTLKVTRNGELVGYFVGKEKCAEALGINPKTIYNAMNTDMKNRQGYEFEEVEVMPCQPKYN